MDDAETLRSIEAIRHFNRFYTEQIGVLQEGLLDSPFSLTEARVLYELAHLEQATSRELGDRLGLDAGYLSRILQGFQAKRLLQKKPSATDGRQSILRLTKRGAAAFAKLNADTREQVQAMLDRLAEPDRGRLTGAMRTIEELLAPPETRESVPRKEAPPSAPYILRRHRPGDIGWVIYRHGLVYAREYGWNEEFEALVGAIASGFLHKHDPEWERCWIAEMDGENVGSIFLVKKSATVAKLRLLLVEPQARGLGLGRRLVEECIDFAREAGYRKVTLWTNSVLHAARHIYIETGFELVAEEPHHSFGHDLVSQTWELKL